MTDFYDLFDRPKKQERPTLTVVAERRPGGDLHPYAAAAVASELARLDNLPRPWSPNSYWDTTTFEVACNLLEIANSPWSGYKVTDAETDLYARAPQDSRWGPREHEAKWKSARERIGAQGRPEPAPGEKYEPPAVTLLPDVVASADGEETDVAQLVRERFPLLDFQHLLSTEDDGEEWIVEPILPARRLVALYSAPKVGKSLLMLEIAVGVGLGREVLGVVPEVRKVLYVDFENDPRGDVKRRLEAMGYGPEDGADLNAGLCYLSFPTLAKLDTPQGGYEILTTAREYGCEVVVIDTVSRAVGGEENDNDTWLSFYRNTGMLLKGAGIACIRLDHSGKDAEKGMRGGSAKYGDVDAVWKLTTEVPGGTVLELVCTDHRMPLEQDRLTLVRESHPNLHHRAVGDRMMALDAREQEIDQTIDRLHIEPGASANEVYRRLREAGNGFNKQAVLRVVKARKLRLPTPSQVVPEPPRNHPEPPAGEVVPGAPLRSRAPEPPAATGSREPEPEALAPMFLVACKRCFAPMDRDESHRHGRLCSSCRREAGIAPDEPEPA